MNLDRMFQAGVAIAALGVILTAWPQPGAAAYGRPGRYQPATYRRRGPLVLIDRGHWNHSPADPAQAGLSDLLAWDGYRFSRTRQELVPEMLKGASVLVIPNALGWKGELRRVIGWSQLHPEAVTAEEIAAIRSWVMSGGSLLLVADHALAAEASQRLAQAFGATFANGRVQGPPGSIVLLGREESPTAVAIQADRGRVVIVAEPLAKPANRQVVLDLFHWLTRVL